MAEHWISAAKALEIGQSRVAICTRAYAGLIRTRARLFVVGDAQQEWADVPKDFWWAKGHAALQQDWRSGDFSTWIEQRRHLKAFGVSFALPDVLEMIDFPQRPLIARSLSVAGDPDWMTAREAEKAVAAAPTVEAYNAAKYLFEQARIGFVAARAVKAEALYGDKPKGEGAWEAREWDVPISIWQMLAEAEEYLANWDVGKISGRGRSIDGVTIVILSGVHFHRASIEAITGPRDSKAEIEGRRGRRPTYKWETATAAIWGKLFRSELMPETQADIERALIEHLANGDKEPSPSTVRPYAKPIWEEFQKS